MGVFFRASGVRLFNTALSLYLSHLIYCIYDSHHEAAPATSWTCCWFCCCILLMLFFFFLTLFFLKKKKSFHWFYLVDNLVNPAHYSRKNMLFPIIKPQQSIAQARLNEPVKKKSHFLYFLLHTS